MKEIRVAILGNVDSAKSSLVSTITYKILDDSRGSARGKVFKHKHEKETGRTSSISFMYVKINEEKYITLLYPFLKIKPLSFYFPILRLLL